MERDERLLPLPNIGKLQPTETEQDYPASYPSSYDDISVDGRSIQEYLHVVYKRLPIILALTILATAVTAFYMYRQASMYSATTEMIIEPRKRAAVQTIVLDSRNDIQYRNTQLKLLKNRDLMYDVVVAKGLYKNPILIQNQKKGFLVTLRSMFSGGQPPSQDTSLNVISDSTIENDKSEEVVLSKEDKGRADTYANSLLGGITVSKEDRTNIVRISVTNTNPALAATVANGVADEFIRQDRKRETGRAETIFNNLTGSIKDLKDTIKTDESNLIGIMKRSGMALADGDGGEVSKVRLNTISSQWLEAMDQRRKIEANYTTALKSKDLSVLPPDIINSESMLSAQKLILEERSSLKETIRAYDKQISDAETKRKELLVRYTPEYSEVKEIEAKIGRLKEARASTEKRTTASIETEQKKVKSSSRNDALSGLRAQLDAARTRESKLLGEYSKEVSSANNLGQAARELTTAKREIETNRKLLDTYIQRQKEQEQVISTTTPDNISVISPAVTPTAPYGPERNRNIFLAFLVSLLGGVGLAFLLDYLDDSIRTSDDISRNLSLPTLALIPHQDALGKGQLTSIAASSKGDGQKEHSLALIALQDTRSAIAEAYRHLRTSLLFSSAGKPPQTILVTSSQPSEGKTTTAINTAITLAQSGDEVAIIDCDLRRPRLHSHFGMTNSHGLTNYLSGDKNTENLLKPLPDLPNLKIITSGPIPPNPAELLSSNEMKNVLQFLKGNYKHVILDSPPAISFTDAAILSTLVDGVVLVAMAGSSSIHLMKRFKQRLAGLGTKIYGVVLNGVKANSLEYGYYGYNYSYDYYANSDNSTPLLEDEPEYVLDESSEGDNSESVHETKD